MKRHKTVHENVIYLCPYCPSKVVKRKPSIMKHLRILHKEHKAIWNDSKFIANLKQRTGYPSNTQQSENVNNSELNLMESIDTEVIDNNYSIIENINFATKHTLNSHCPDFTETNPLNDLEMMREEQQLTQDKLYENSNHNSATETDVILNIGNSELHEITFIERNKLKLLSNNDFERNTIPMTSNMINTDDKSQIIRCIEDDEANANYKMSCVNMTTQASLENIIENYFFTDENLNCNAVLHSPFSSDNDADGFIMTNGDEKCTTNNELLNKFHDRLEEMEEKIDNTSFKAIWNHMLVEDDDLHDGMIDPAIETVADVVDDNSANNDFPSVTTVK